MQNAIREFRDSYADQFAMGMSQFLSEHGQAIISQLHSCLGRPRNTIYLFGNGGSHAIAKCISYALRSYAASHSLPLRVHTGIDVHEAACLPTDGSPGIPFLRVLEIEGAGSDDLVVLISGSGNSDNLCEVAQYTKRFSIPTLALIGSRQGKLREWVSQASCLCVPLEDQQISEDIIQSLACFLEYPCPNNALDWKESVAAQAGEIVRALRRIPTVLINSVADEILKAFYHREFVWLFGFDHPVLSVCAEHAAHNLYWDGVYQIDDPPPRFVRSSPTACDFSGISNDRRRGMLTYLSGINEGAQTGAAILYSMTSSRSSLQEILEKLNASRTRSFLLSAEIDLGRRYDCIDVYATGLREPQTQAVLLQMFGHMLGRVVRLKLAVRQGWLGKRKITDPTHFLINLDLAQRRLLDG
jgi:D-sedoheptulose 7-phosphate isomerase